MSRSVIRSIALVAPSVAYVALLATGSSRAAPQEVFESGPPATPPEVPGGAKLTAAEESYVSSKTGSATYALPIEVPPGRLDMAPKLALTYSSDNPLRGGIAAAWELNVPSIQLDTSRIDGGAPRYVSALSDGHLIPVDEPARPGYVAYRAKHDSGYLRYQHCPPASTACPPNTWIAMTPDGDTHYFGEIEGAHGDHNALFPLFWAPTILEGGVEVPNPHPPAVEAYLSRSVDRFGNMVEYFYAHAELASLGASDVYLDRVEYTRNPGAGITAYHAQVDLLYSDAIVCDGMPRGAELTLRGGARRVRGMKRLDAVNIYARQTPTQAPILRRRYELFYHRDDQSCGDDANLRRLDEVRQSASPPDAPTEFQSKPPITFTYGEPDATRSGASKMLPSMHLSRGTRKVENSQFAGVETRLVDFDGDGAQDLLEVADGRACTVTVTTNQGDQFTFALPTIAWGSPDYWLASQERCTLDWQFTGMLGSTAPSCDLGDGTTVEPEDFHMGSYLTYSWLDVNGDGRSDLVTQHVGNPTYVGIAGPDPWYPPPPSNPDPGDNHAYCSQVSASRVVLRPELDSFPWTVYWNEGTSLSSATTLTAPVSLVDEHRSQRPHGVTSGGGRLHALVADVNGDGFPDALTESHPEAEELAVYLGRGELGFDAAVSWEKPGHAPLYPCDPNDDPDGDGVPNLCPSIGSFVDVNGDGLPDLVVDNGLGSVQTIPAGVYTYLNDAYARQLTDAGYFTSPDLVFPLEHNAVWGDVSQGVSTQHIGGRFIDYDGDGLLDYLQSLHDDVDGDGRADTYDATLYHGRGNGLFTSAVPLTPPAGIAAEHAPTSRAAEASSSSLTWWVKGDLMDLDGDGRTEWLWEDYDTATQEGQGIHSERALDLAPLPVLLMNVDDGYKDIAFDYASMNDYALDDGSGCPPGATVCVGADDLRSPGRRWVVESVTLNPRVATIGSPVELTTAFQYRYPVYNQEPTDAGEPLGRWGFRGFEEVETTKFTGARAVETYAYDLYWRGLPVENVVYDAAGAPHRVTRQVGWTEYELLGGVRTYHNRKVDIATCLPGQTVAQCTYYGLRLTKNTLWQGWRESGTEKPVNDPDDPSDPVVIYAHRHTSSIDRQSDVRSTGAGYVDTRFDYDYYTLRNDADTYRLLRIRDYARHWDDDAQAYVMHRKRNIAFDPDWLYEQRIDDYSATFGTVAPSRTLRTVDPATGVLMEEMRPNQTASGGASIQYGHDSFKLFVTSTTNELGHTVEEDVDVATGAVVATYGPNPEEQTRTEVDGFGRPTSTFQTVEVPGGGVELQRMACIEYDDDNLHVSGSANWIRTIQVSEIGYGELDCENQPGVTTTVHVDGFGRPIASIADKEVRFRYGVSDKLEETRVLASPTGAAESISYTSNYDSLGRIVQTCVPDGPSSSAPVTCGDSVTRRVAEVSYDGLTETHSEVVFDGSPAATKVLVHDVFGRLREVHEDADGAWAVTTYEYDGNDNMRRIEDPDGVVTVLDHDWLGRRTAIARGDRTWTYVYDDNGNPIAETVPYPIGADPLDYTISIAYDALDRVTSRTAGSRVLSDDEVRELGVAKPGVMGALTVYTYDDPAIEHSIGRLTSIAKQVDVDNDGTWVDLLRTSHAFDARGNVTELTRSFDLTPTLPAPSSSVFADTGTTYTSYDALGNPTEVWHADGIPGDTATHITYAYDARGRPDTAVWHEPGGDPYVLADNERNAFGLVTKRTGWSTSGVPIENRWVYDRLGRIASHNVLSQGAFVASQSFNYWDSGDPLGVEQFLDDGTGSPVTHQFDYEFDTRHQLVHTAWSDSESGRTGTFQELSYTLGGRLASARVEHLSEYANVVPRDVVYERDDITQREAPDVLRSSDGSEFATFLYDEAGNVEERMTAWEDLTLFLYDGEDDTRRVEYRDGRTEVYYYDDAGRRVLAVTKQGVDGPIERVRFWNGMTEIWYDASGEVIERWVTVDLGTPVARIDDRTREKFLATGAASHVLAAFDADGTLDAAYVYGPFGEIVDQAGPETDEYLRRFNGKEYDTASGISYYGYRYYDSLSLMWLQADPLFRFLPDAAYDEPRRAALYLFSLGNPLRYLDPDGRNPNTDAGVPVPDCPNGICDAGTGRSAEERLDLPTCGSDSVAGANVECIHSDEVEQLCAQGAVHDRCRGVVETISESAPVTVFKIVVCDGVTDCLVTAALAAGTAGVAGLAVKGWKWIKKGKKATRAARAVSASEATAATRGASTVGRTINETVGDKAASVVRAVLKGKQPPSALSQETRQAAAAFYRDVATRTTGRHAAAASQYNVARAEYLEGTRSSLPPTLPEFMKAMGLK